MNVRVKFGAYCAVAMACWTSVPSWSAAASCMVVGPRDAKVKAVEGDRSPVFVTKDCAALRLLSGAAQASWVGQDGKPHMIPITADGVATQPQASSEERSVNVVWAELTTKRERQQPAYMRSSGFERPAKVYLPADGLLLIDRAEVDVEVSIQWQKESGAVDVIKSTVKRGDSLRLPRTLLEADQVYAFTLRRNDSSENWRWKTLPGAQADTLDAQMNSIAQATVDPEQRLLLQAMLFDQLKIKSNMDLTVQQLRILDDLKAAGQR